MLVRKFSSPQPLKDIWCKIYQRSKNLSVFQNYETAELFHKSFHVEKHRWCFHEVYYYVEDGKESLILPLAVDIFHKRVYSLSYYSSLDYYDVIISIHNDDFLRRALRLVLSLYDGYTFYYRYVNQSSALARILPPTGSKEICVSISLEYPSYKEYYQNLSKHQRQNLRTAYNKLRKENTTFCLKKYSHDHAIDNITYEVCQQMYENRCDRKNNPRLALLRRRIHRIGNPVYKMVREETDFLIYVLYLNEEPVAWLGGGINASGKSFSIPRLSTSNKWLKYSTGIILVNETIKDLMKGGIITMDLTRGNEPYKYAMGGIEHYNYSGIVKVNKLLEEL